MWPGAVRVMSVQHTTGVPVRRRLVAWSRTPRGRLAGLVSLAVAWVAAYRANGPLWDGLLYDMFGMDRTARLTETLHFFGFDTVKITLLLVGIIFVVTVLRSHMSVERTRALPGGRREGAGNVLAASLGGGHPVLLPQRRAGVHRVRRGGGADRGDAEFPDRLAAGERDRRRLVNEIAVGMLLSLFGWRIAAGYIAAGYIAAGLAVAIVAGWVLGQLKAECWVEPFVFETRLSGQTIDSTASLTFDQRLRIGAEEVVTILRKIWPYLLVGIGLGAVIHDWAPADLFTRYAGPGNALGVLVAVAIGAPLYSNAAGIMPLVQVLHDKGLPMGTLLAFMMSVVALSLPELILLRRVLKPQLLVVFVAVVATGITGVGYLFNAVLT